MSSGKEDVIDLEVVYTLLDAENMSNNKPGAAISAWNITSVNEHFVDPSNGNLGHHTQDWDQGATIPELAQKGKNDELYKALMEAVKEGSRRRLRTAQ